MATVGSSNLTSTAAHQALGSRFMARVAAGAPTVGKALLSAKRELYAASPNTFDAIWGQVLLGDPATPLPRGWTRRERLRPGPERGRPARSFPEKSGGDARAPSNQGGGRRARSGIGPIGRIRPIGPLGRAPGKGGSWRGLPSEAPPPPSRGEG